MTVLVKIRKTLADLRQMGLSRRMAALMLALHVLAIGLEGFGLAMLLPILEFLRNGGGAGLRDKGRYWAWLQEAADALHVDLSLGALLLATFLVIAARQMVTYLRLRLRAVVRQRAAHQLRMRGLAAFLAARSYWQRNIRVGELVNDFVVELPLAVNALYDSIMLIGSFGTILVYVGLLVALSPVLTLVTLAILAIAALFLRPALRGTRKSSAAVTDANKNIGAFLSERFRAARLVRLAATEQLELRQMEAISLDRARSTTRMQLLSARTASAIEPLTVGMGFLVIFFGYTWASMSLEAIAVFLLILIRLLPTAKEAFGDYQTNQAQWVNFEVVRDRLMEMEQAAEDRSRGGDFPGLASEVRFERVSLSFPGAAEPALNDITLSIPAGRITTLMGPSGAGKSTLIDCLPRLIQPDAGCILIDGRPLEEIRIASLRQHIAYVPQEPQLFDITAAEHIAYGMATLDRATVLEAAQAAGAHNFIQQLPNGYDTRLGEAARRLSGGQRQRLDLARAIAQKTPLLILDEPASALDAESEAGLLDALMRLRAAGNKTIVVVAHSFAFARIADQVVVLQAGRVSEAGDHDSLMRASGWYRQAFSKASERKTVKVPEYVLVNQIH